MPAGMKRKAAPSSGGAPKAAKAAKAAASETASAKAAAAAPAAGASAGLSKTQLKKQKKKANAAAAAEEEARKKAAAVESLGEMFGSKKAKAPAAPATEARAAPAAAAAATPADGKAPVAEMGNIFESLKARKKQKEAGAAEAPEGGAGEAKIAKPQVTGPHRGYIPAGGNLAQGRMTIAEATQRALKNPACLGFTYEGKLGKDKKALIWLKNKYPEKLEEPNGPWISYKVTNRTKMDDAFLDLRGDGAVQSARTTGEGYKVVAADELVMDSGGFTKDCPFDCQCCF